MACLTESTLHGYLAEFGAGPLAPVVENHLGACARCRASFDRVVATNRRVNSWLAKLSAVEEPAPVDTNGALRALLNRTPVFRLAEMRSTNPKALISSFIFQGAMVALLLSFGATQIVRAPATFTALIAPPPAPKPILQRTQSGGGGGQHSSLPPSQLPKPGPKVFVAPLAPIREPVPIALSLVAPTDVWGAATSPIGGNPLGGLHGGEAGPGTGNTTGSGGDVNISPVASGATKPEVITRFDPEYSEEARKAKYSGAVILSIVVDTDGKATGIKVVKSLGMGLDEKAIEAVQKWRFKPGMSKGTPVRVRAQIEINFRLL